MPVDPRRAGGGSAEVRGAQRIADLERRLGQLERGPKGAIIASGITQQAAAATYNYTFPSATVMPWSGVTLTAQVPTVAILTFTGTVYCGASNLSYGFATTQLYKGATLQDGDATLDMTITTGTTISIATSASIAHSWRVSLAAGSTSLALWGVGVGNLKNGSLTYIQTRA